MHVEEIMSTDVRVIQPDDTLDHAWYLMEAHGIRHLVVVGENGRTIGVLSSTDIGTLPASTRQNRQVRDYMSTDLVSVKPQTTIKDAANLFRGHAVNCLPVIEDNKLVGLITTTDLLELIGRGKEGNYPSNRRQGHRHQPSRQRQKTYR
jgi:CBS domain-containing protein